MSIATKELRFAKGRMTRPLATIRHATSNGAEEPFGTQLTPCALENRLRPAAHHARWFDRDSASWPRP